MKMINKSGADHFNVNYKYINNLWLILFPYTRNILVLRPKPILHKRLLNLELKYEHHAAVIKSASCRGVALNENTFFKKALENQVDALYCLIKVCLWFTMVQFALVMHILAPPASRHDCH